LLLFAVSAVSASAKPALWLVSDDDTKVYVIGTMTALCPNANWFQGEVKRAFDQSGELVIEVEPADGKAAGTDFLKLASTMKAAPLRDRLDPAIHALLDAELKRLGYGPSMFDKFEVWAVAVMLPSLATRTSCLNVEHGVETVLTRAARHAGKPVSGIESGLSQLSALAGLSPVEQARFLEVTIRDNPGLLAYQDRLQQAWLSADMEVLLSERLRVRADMPFLDDPLFLERNRMTTEWITNRMKSAGTAFVAVTALHTIGPASVIELATQAGFKVKRVQ
jgi:uncharacterized protein YbaP (TraB family)